MQWNETWHKHVASYGRYSDPATAPETSAALKPLQAMQWRYGKQKPLALCCRATRRYSSLLDATRYSGASAGAGAGAGAGSAGTVHSTVTGTVSASRVNKAWPAEWR